MLSNEAEWLGREIYSRPTDDVFPLLNIGSCSADFRRRVQPHIWNYIEKPAVERGLPMIHVDLESAPGVDVVGDALDPAMQNRLRSIPFRSILCSNLLEHVEDVQELASIITGILLPGGYAFISAPRLFPYHPHPIDNGFRPSADELAAVFGHLEPRRCETVACGRGFAAPPARRRDVIWAGARSVLPFYRPRRHPAMVKMFREMVQSVSATCAVFQQPLK